MSITTDLPQSTAEYTARFGSELAIAFALHDRDRKQRRLSRIVQSHKHVQDLLESEGGDLDIDDDANAAFLMLRCECENSLKEIEGRLNEIFALGRITGTEPCTDKHFSGNGLQRPSQQLLNDFFAEVDN